MFFRKRQDQGLGHRLRSLGAEPRDEFMRSLATEVRSSRVRTAMRSRRVLAAGVTSGLMLIPCAAFGGVGYAAQAAKGAAQTVSNTASNNKGNDNSGANNKGNNNAGDNNKVNSNAGDNNKGNGKRPPDDQYKPGKGCGDKNHVHEREDECKNPPK